MLSPSGRVARSAERGHDRTRPLQSAIADSFPSVACRCSRLPLACIKFCLQNFLRQKCEAFPYVKASPCFFLLSQKSAKIVSRYAASPRGEAPPKGGGEGQLHLPCQKFSNKGAVSFPFKIISHESVAPLIRLAFARHLPPKGKASFLPYFRASPWGEAPPRGGGEGQFQHRIVFLTPLCRQPPRKTYPL